MYKVRGEDNWRYFTIKLEVPIRNSLSIISLRIEFNSREPLKGPTAEIPLSRQIDAHNGDIVKFHVPTDKSPQTTLLAWMWSRLNRPIQVRLGLTSFPNTWDGREINVYQSLFHLERSSS